MRHIALGIYGGQLRRMHLNSREHGGRIVFFGLKVTHGVLRPKVLVFEVENIITVYQSFNATLARHVSR